MKQFISNGIILNGTVYQLVDYPANGIIECVYCDLRSHCHNFADPICSIVDKRCEGKGYKAIGRLRELNLTKLRSRTKVDNVSNCKLEDSTKGRE